MRLAVFRKEFRVVRRENMIFDPFEYQSLLSFPFVYRRLRLAADQWSAA